MVGAAACCTVLSARSTAAVPSAVIRQRLANFACNMESWWTNLPFMRRFERAAEHGFSAVEFWNLPIF